MPPLSLQQLYEQYGRLRAQLQGQQLTYDQFVAAVRQLQAQDAAGNWWTIDPQTGQYLTYTAGGWVAATPSSSQPQQSARQSSAQSTPQAVQASNQARQAAQPQQAATGKPGCLASPIVTLLLSVGTALVWFAYSSLSPSSEGTDLLTPLLIAGMPLAIRLLRKPLDKLLTPVYKILSALPRPLLVGAAFAVPVVIAVLFTRANGGYQGIRRSAFISVIFGHILTRRPEGMA